MEPRSSGEIGWGQAWSGADLACDCINIIGEGLTGLVEDLRSAKDTSPIREPLFERVAQLAGVTRTVVG